MSHVTLAQGGLELPLPLDLPPSDELRGAVATTVAIAAAVAPVATAAGRAVGCGNRRAMAIYRGCASSHESRPFVGPRGGVLIPNVEVTGAAQLHRAASGGPPGWASIEFGS